jgi:hypothetical protein
LTFANGRRRNRPLSDRKTFAGDLREALLVQVRAATSLTWPSPKYAKDPVGFCRDILGFEPWSRQRDIMRAVVDHPLVTVKSGHKVGKSCSAASLALWFYEAFDDARVICTGPNAVNVQTVVWREIRKLAAKAGRCVACVEADPNGPRPCPHSALIDGKLAERAGTGLVARDFREIHGYTVRDVDALGGLSGTAILFIADEASGVDQEVFDALEGNRASWSEDPKIMVRMLLTGNPLWTTGEFYDSHEHPKKKTVYHQIHVSSTDSPNVTEGRIVVPGLATREWVAQMKAKYGEDSQFYKVRVLGEFPIGEDGKIFSIKLITESEERWDNPPEDTDDGLFIPLQIGVDPAGEAGTGDQVAMVPRRGDRALAIRRWPGLSEEGHGVQLLALIEEFRKHPNEKAIVVCDSAGKVGWDVYTHLRSLANKPNATFELHRMRTSDKAIREPKTFDLLRDELAHQLFLWMRDGGAIPGDELLEAELHALEWDTGAKGRLKLTPKKAIRKLLERSPDSYDALSMAVWPVLREDELLEDDEDEDEDDEDWGDIDPYEDDGIDPYG